jgi:hypothetical protein
MSNYIIKLFLLVFLYTASASVFEDNENVVEIEDFKEITDIKKS